MFSYSLLHAFQNYTSQGKTSPVAYFARFLLERLSTQTIGLWTTSLLPGIQGFFSLEAFSQAKVNFPCAAGAKMDIMLCYVVHHVVRLCIMLCYVVHLVVLWWSIMVCCVVHHVLCCAGGVVWCGLVVLCGVVRCAVLCHANAGGVACSCAVLCWWCGVVCCVHLAAPICSPTRLHLKMNLRLLIFTPLFGLSRFQDFG